MFVALSVGVQGIWKRSQGLSSARRGKERGARHEAGPMIGRFKVILAVDVGNTNIVLGGIRDGKQVFSARLASDRNKTESICL
jgi:hypothetical protein